MVHGHHERGVGQHAPVYDMEDIPKNWKETFARKARGVQEAKYVSAQDALRCLDEAGLRQLGRELHEAAPFLILIMMSWWVCSVITEAPEAMLGQHVL